MVRNAGSMKNIFLLFVWIFSLAHVCQCSTLPEDIYHVIPVPDGSACFRLLNGTHQFGCHSSKADGHGVVVIVKNESEVADIHNCWRKRFAHYDGGFFVMIDVSLLGKQMVTALRDSRCVRGILLTDRTENLVSDKMGRSHDGQCPNEASGFYRDGCAKNAWNAKGAILPEGLMRIDWRKQIVFLSNETYISDVERCHSLFNVPSSGSGAVNYPFCSASFAMRSSAAGNSQICYRRSIPGANVLDQFLNFDGPSAKCHPLSGANVLGLIPPNAYKKNRSEAEGDKYMMIAGRLDSFGLVPEVSPADLSVMTSFIALMAALKSIGEKGDEIEEAANRTGRYLLFTLFDGEAFDYIGSSSMMFNIQQGDYPFENKQKSTLVPEEISASQIVSVLEVQQLGTGGQLHAIVDGNQLNRQAAEISPLLKSLEAGARLANGSIANPLPNGRIPPASWHSVARVHPGAVGVVVAPFTKEYEYGRINSMMDRNNWTSDAIRGVAEKQIVVAASAVARAAASHVGLSEAELDSMRIDEGLVTKLFDCLVVEDDYLACDFFRNLSTRVVGDGYAGKSTYVGVYDRSVLRHVAEELAILLSGSTAHTGNVKDAQTCRDLEKGKLYNYIWKAELGTGEMHCYRHNIYRDTVESPAFKIPGYDFTNGTYSTWTESMYSLDSLRLFLLEKRVFEWYLFMIGCCIAILSALLVGRCSEETFVIDEGEPQAEQGEPL